MHSAIDLALLSYETFPPIGTYAAFIWGTKKLKMNHGKVKTLPSSFSRPFRVGTFFGDLQKWERVSEKPFLEVSASHGRASSSRGSGKKGATVMFLPRALHRERERAKATPTNS